MANLIVIAFAYIAAVVFSIRAFIQMREASSYRDKIIHPTKRGIAETICKNSQEGIVGMIFFLSILEL